MPDWEKQGSKTLLELGLFKLLGERFVSPRTGKPLDAVVLDSLDYVNVVGLTSDDQIVLVRQFRFGTQELSLEIPGGLVDLGEEPLASAKRELREETGYVAERWTSLGAVTPNPAFMRNHLHLYLAEGCELAGAQQQDPGEDIEVLLRPLAQVDAMVASGEMDHALVVVAFLKLKLRRAGLLPDPG